MSYTTEDHEAFLARAATCHRKVAHRSRLSHMTGRRLVEYECQHCGCWHTGHDHYTPWRNAAVTKSRTS